MLSAGAIGTANVISSTASLQKENGVIGNIGSRVDLGWNNTISVNVLTADLAESITAKKEVIGLPLCSTVELGTLTGYVQTQNVSVQAIAMEEELQQINSMLDRGVYIE